MARNPITRISHCTHFRLTGVPYRFKQASIRRDP